MSKKWSNREGENGGLDRREFIMAGLALTAAAAFPNMTAAAPKKADLVNKEAEKMERTVFFKNNQIQMAGILFLPDDFNENKKYPALVISSPAGAVKEQSPSLYGKKMAKKGFIALAFDTSHQGESGGEPRYLENPTERVEEVRCAVDYLTTLQYVDVERIGAMGICSGGGYAVSAAITEHRIKAVAGVSTTDPGSWIRDGLDGNTPVAEQIKLLEMVGKQRTAEANGPNRYTDPTCRIR